MKREDLSSRRRRFHSAFCNLHCAFLIFIAWTFALPGWHYRFPEDHGVHPDFKTEWWYFTGNVRDENNREFGFHLTFFRQGVRETDGREHSRFVVNDFKFAHFAISDIAAKRFHFQQKVSRGAFGEAGCATAGRIAWIDGWTFDAQADGSFHLQAASEIGAIKLRVEPEKPAVIHGENGVSQKAEGAGRASHYYSFTRMKTTGQIVLAGRTFTVSGESWFDHEWATNQLTADQAGWDWFSVQLSDQTELMLYQMRLKNGGIDPNSSGTFVDRNGVGTYLRRDDYKLTPLEFWRSAETGANYPIKWRLEIPRLKIHLDIATPLDQQELVVKPVVYWEGAIRGAGERDGRQVSGHGYMELTGYSGALRGMAE